jgi:hypothetical protein
MFYPLDGAPEFAATNLGRAVIEYSGTSGQAIVLHVVNNGSDVLDG